MLRDPKKEAEIEFEIKIAKEPWRKALLKTAEILRERGWCSGKFEDAHGRRCVLGALHAVALEGDRYTIQDAWTYDDAATRLRQHVILPVAQWNDQSDAETVIATLELVARS